MRAVTVHPRRLVLASHAQRCPAGTAAPTISKELFGEQLKFVLSDKAPHDRSWSIAS